MKVKNYGVKGSGKGHLWSDEWVQVFICDRNIIKHEEKLLKDKHRLHFSHSPQYYAQLHQIMMLSSTLSKTPICNFPNSAAQMLSEDTVWGPSLWSDYLLNLLNWRPN